MLFYPIHYRHDPASTDLPAILGGKGAGLAIMAGELGLPVPSGFTITTDACRTFLDHGWSNELEEALRQGVAGIEADTDRRFGDAAEPLLVSVRSGAPVSMPGMLDTILNVGVTEKTQPGLEFLGAAAAEECKRALDAARRQLESGKTEGTLKFADRSDWVRTTSGEWAEPPAAPANYPAAW